MTSKIKYLFFIAVLAVSGCNSVPSSEDIPSNSDITNSEGPLTSEDITSSENQDSSSEEPSSELPPLSDPDVAGLTRSTLWPSEALDGYLMYASNIDMPVLASTVDWHHGEVENELYLPFYRVMTRVHSKTDFNQYLNVLNIEYDFSVTEEEELVDVYYLVSQYDDVRLYAEYRVISGHHEVYFDFFDGDGDKYTGPVAVDNVARFNLRTKEALTSYSPTRAKWEVRPATFTVYQRTSGYIVGNTNGEHISNNLRLYPGQEAVFAVSSKYYIESIDMLAASGYAEETVLNGTFTNANAIDDGDWVRITAIGTPSEISYKLAQVMYVGQVRWVEFNIILVKR